MREQVKGYAAQRLKETIDKLEAGIAELFESSQYKDYLSAMSKFHRYSYGNILLIVLQCPNATCVASAKKWREEFGRTVKKDESSIRILAPCTYKKWTRQSEINSTTQGIDAEQDRVEQGEWKLVSRQGFKAVPVFDLSQTEGRELPRLGVDELTGEVAGYDATIGALKEMSPVPVRFEAPDTDAKGCYNRAEDYIAVRPDLSQVQTIKTLIHEIAHAKLHKVITDDTGRTKPRPEREVEAESVAYVVCQYLGVDTSDYTFGYIAGWSKKRELPELKSALDTIRKAAAELIDGLEAREIVPQKTILPQPKKYDRAPVR